MLAMASREIVLDTETTGISVWEGHRVIEIAAVELVDLIPTGNTFHRYIDPGRPIPADATRIHGITNAMLEGAPKFDDVADEFLDFLGDAPAVAHNAKFDETQVNAELERSGRPPTAPTQWIDTLKIARKKFPGMGNSLDALCKRFKISLAERDKHGALVDTKLLAAVYLELSGGREMALDLASPTAAQQMTGLRVAHPRPRPLIHTPTPEELAAHQAFVREKLGGKSLWHGPGYDTPHP